MDVVALRAARRAIVSGLLLAGVVRIGRVDEEPDVLG